VNSSLASLKDFRKRPFWRVLEFAKIGEFLGSTRIRQIRCRVAIAYFNFKIVIKYFTVEKSNENNGEPFGISIKPH
jgi:hypothetical protein